MRAKFSVEEANRTLPLVRRIVSDAVRDYWRWQEKVREYEEVAANRKVDEPSDDCCACNCARDSLVSDA